MIAILTSPSLNVSVIFRSGSVLFTTVSTTETLNCTVLAASAVPAVLKGSRSSAITGREYELVSGGELRMSSSALEGVDTLLAARRAKHAAHATVRASLHSVSCFIVVSSHNDCDPPPDRCIPKIWLNRNHKVDENQTLFTELATYQRFEMS